jgi:hypothetical protein
VDGRGARVLAPPVQLGFAMPSKAPGSYDDIVRRTVPNPDTSFRPTRAQVEDAYKDPADRPDLHLDADERALRDRVRAAFASDPSLYDARIRVDIEGTTVVLSGTVNGPPLVHRAEEIVRTIEGVRDVDNELSPGTPVPPIGSPS